MKLTDFLSDVGRPIAFYPSLRRITGSTNATIFLCQLIYWKGKEADPEGWIYKTSDEMETETGLSYDEQKTARNKLKDAGLIEEHYARLDHQMRYRLNTEKIDASWGCPVPESRITALGKADSPLSLNSNTESTTENNNDASLDMVDFELSKLPAISLRNAIRDYFWLNINWDTKTARQWLEWAHGENITAEQIKQAADTWRMDKQFNWAQPTLKGIFEKWQLLMNADKKSDERTSMLRTL